MIYQVRGSFSQPYCIYLSRLSGKKNVAYNDKYTYQSTKAFSNFNKISFTAS